jgi:phthalate 4,5-dioxygenase oxygenase subunit
MTTREENERLTRVGPGTPMGELMRRYWMPAAFADAIPKPDCPPVRVRLLGEDLVLFRATDGRIGLVAERCPHRTASMYYGRNEENGLRCVYHGLKFDVDGNCVDAPCVPKINAAQLDTYKQQLRIKAYPCIEKAELIWTYMGPPELMPAFPDLEWTHIPPANRLTTRHIQECNWLQALEGGFDASHLTFLHRGESDPTRNIVPDHYEVVPIDCGMAIASGRETRPGTTLWSINPMMMPFHKVIATALPAAHMWMPIDDHNTMLYSTDFHPGRPLTQAEIERAHGGSWIHTENMPGTDHALRHRGNDYLIDRALQASGTSYTGLKGLAIQDCAIQESMGPIAAREEEFLLPGDAGIVKIRRLLLKAMEDMAAGRQPPGVDPASYRVRSVRFEAPTGAPVATSLAERVRADLPKAAE